LRPPEKKNQPTQKGNTPKRPGKRIGISASGRKGDESTTCQKKRQKPTNNEGGKRKGRRKGSGGWGCDVVKGRRRTKRIPAKTSPGKRKGIFFFHREGGTPKKGGENPRTKKLERVVDPFCREKKKQFNRRG